MEETGLKIMVFNVPAVSGGALTILENFYEEAKQCNEDIEWIFVLSTPKIKGTNNIHILNYKWVKKNWLFRLFFDYFIAPKIVKKYAPDKIFSLQNVVVPKTNVKQVVYLHQPLPFSQKKFNLFKNPKLWIYQNVISKSIINSVKKADKVIVQMNWFAEEILKKVRVPREKILVLPPKVVIDKSLIKCNPKDNTSNKNFFFPAASYVYKNHEVIVKACKELKRMGVNNYRVVFTLNGDENKKIGSLKKIVEKNNLPIYFVGNLNKKQVFEEYSNSTLIFPSYIETFGLPLLEMRLLNRTILASDTQFSREILEGYNFVSYFQFDDYKKLAQLMENEMLSSSEKINLSENINSFENNDSLISQVIL